MQKLACFAAREEFSHGRMHKEDSPALRNQFQRDRDRILHSSAFRRLEYKTQVFINHEGDMFRTRLTHSLEVSQIGRTIARALELNEDLTEAICLAHDLGHTPFGHAGQDVLNDCMKDYGGFEHNLQSLRVVDVLEEKYAEFPGLNLLFETREGILKHCSRSNAKKLGELGMRFLNKTQPGLEAQVANVADEIAYNNHDVDDGLRANLITMEQLNECSLFRDQYDHVFSIWPDIGSKRQTHEMIRRMINCLVTDLVTNSRRLITDCEPRNIEEVRNAGTTLIGFSEAMGEKHMELKRFLRKHLYNHDHVILKTRKASSIITTLFDAYLEKPELLPGDLQDKLANGNNQALPDRPRQRVIADYIAGMTDRFAITEAGRITGGHVDLD